MKKLNEACIDGPGSQHGTGRRLRRVRDADAALPAAAGLRRHHRSRPTADAFVATIKIDALTQRFQLAAQVLGH